MNLENLKVLAAALPKEYKAHAEELLSRMEEVVEGIGDEPIRWRPPMLKLVQGTTDRNTIPKGTAIGDFVLGQKRIERPMVFIPERIWEGRQFWNPDPNESNLICSSPDGKLGYIGLYCNQCPHAKFDEVARKSECSKTQNVIVISPDLSEIFTITFSKTNYQTGTDLKSQATKASVPIYRRMYSLTTTPNKKYKNVENYALELLEGDKAITPAPLLPFLKELFELVGVDRKENLDKFHEMILSRKANNAALPAPVDEENNTVLLTDDSSDAGGESTVSDLAKNYQV